MASEKPIRVAIIGLGFGAEFIPIYQKYPGAEIHAICRRDRKGLDECGDRYGIKTRYTDYRELLKDPNIDAVHINSPIPDHAWMSVEALKAGKHVACTVPMGTSDRRMPPDRPGPARQRQDLHDDGDGRLQPRVPVRQRAVRQGRAGPAPVPAGEPPARHGRLARLLAGPAADVVRHALRQPLPGDPGQACPERRLPRLGPDPRGAHRAATAARSPIETATFTIKDSDVVAEVTRSLFDTARQYRESFDATGSKKSFEWQQVENEDPVIHTKSTPEHPLTEPEIPRRVKVPDYAHLLPEPIRRFTQPSAIQDAEHLSFLQGGGHGGSHPHLVHAFLAPSRESDRPCPTPRPPPTGPWSASAPTSRR